MFSQMETDLRNNILPDTDLLRKRFAAALTKKMGVIRSPYALWPADPKINPPAKYLLWAAILLQDKDNFRIVEAIISSEFEEKRRAKGETDSLTALSGKIQQLLRAYRDEFIELGTEETFRAKLRHRAAELIPDPADPLV